MDRGAARTMTGLKPKAAARSAGAAALLLVLAGCQSGDGGGGVIIDLFADAGGTGTLGSWFVSSFAPFEVAAANLRNSARYQLQNDTWDWTLVSGPVTLSSFPLASARIEYAHAAGLTGAGQTVAISDAGFLTGHEVFSGTSIDMATYNNLADHGTMVASIVAGRSSGFTGVAPGADLVLGVFDSDTTLADTGEAAILAGAVAWNNSWGYPGYKLTTNDFNAAFSGAEGARYLAALRNFAAQGVVVFAVSNDEDLLSSDLMSALPQMDNSLTEGWLAVINAVPTFTLNAIQSVQRVSSACLEAASYCLAADGAWTAAASGGGYGWGTGSSFAAPQVSGALALLAQAFPDLTPHQLRLRLLASANNDFAGFVTDGSLAITPDFSHDYSEEFGHGFLDVRAALLPIGATTMQLQAGPVALDQAGLRVGGAMGDAVRRSLSDIDLRVTDSLSAGFTMPADILADNMAPQALSARLLARQADPSDAAARVTSFADMPGTELALPSDGDVTARLLLPNTAEGPVGYGLGVTRHFGSGTSGLDLGLKVASDGGALFGLTGGDAAAGSAMLALDLGVTQALGTDGFVRLGASFGLAEPAASGMVASADTTRFNSFGVDLGQSGVFAKGDRLALSVSLPMAVTEGQAVAMLPVVLESGARTLSAVAIDLAPDSRQLDIGLSYLVPFASGSDIKLDLQHSQNYGNIAGLTETAAAISIRYAF